MVALTITPTLRTAGVSYNADSNILEISGISIPENADAFFQPMYEWLEQIVKVYKGKLVVRINLTYFNTSSVRHLLIIIKSLIAAYRDTLTVQWVYESDDEEIKERGEQLSEVVKFPFEFLTEG
jgi:SiaC family regulatory phosphoprotein